MVNGEPRPVCMASAKVMGLGGEAVGDALKSRLLSELSNVVDPVRRLRLSLRERSRVSSERASVLDCSLEGDGDGSEPTRGTSHFPGNTAVFGLPLGDAPPEMGVPMTRLFSTSRWPWAVLKLIQPSTLTP